MINIGRLKPLKRNFPIMIAEKAILSTAVMHLMDQLYSNLKILIIIQKLNLLKIRCFHLFMTQII